MHCTHARLGGWSEAREEATATAAAAAAAVATAESRGKNMRGLESLSAAAIVRAFSPSATFFLCLPPPPPGRAPSIHNVTSLVPHPSSHASVSFEPVPFPPALPPPPRVPTLHCIRKHLAAVDLERANPPTAKQPIISFRRCIVGVPGRYTDAGRYVGMCWRGTGGVRRCHRRRRSRVR